jgi:predicted ATPase
MALVISNIRRQIKPQLMEALAEFFDGTVDLQTDVENGAVQLYLEQGGHFTPASRLSDGTLRYLALLSILLHPNPRQIVVIEEPELGLHPDVLLYVGKLIKQASKRMQIIITTHSQILLDSFTESPEDIVVCRKAHGATSFQRLSRESLSDWLVDHSLGELWNKGEIGGNRW